MKGEKICKTTHMLVEKYILHPSLFLAQTLNVGVAQGNSISRIHEV